MTVFDRKYKENLDLSDHNNLHWLFNRQSYLFLRIIFVHTKHQVWTASVQLQVCGGERNNMGGKCPPIVQSGENVIMHYVCKYILK